MFNFSLLKQDKLAYLDATDNVESRNPHSNPDYDYLFVSNSRFYSLLSHSPAKFLSLSGYVTTHQYISPLTYILFLLVLRSCGHPGRPGYAIVSGKNYWVGSIIRYFCNPGYTLIGHGARRCMSSGSWSGKMPTCKYEKRFLRTFYEKVKNFNNIYSARTRLGPSNMTMAINTS